ncbi:MAG: dTDP-4-dehydrorhamnose reductase [Chloroflexi bacterium RBG_19FT_COMBO_50_10]|nr:MAG: dTDP-4-dehydrorhamnose reductase [Chloroflexi bacterium RBG_19FT_COMBO_50_10]
MTNHSSYRPARILLIGNTGQLGWELERTLTPLGELYTCDYPQVDLAKMESIRQVFHQCKPELIINAAAYTAVDRAESEPDLATAINATAPAIMAEEAQLAGAAFIHFSTDYVFDGLKGAPYLETDHPNPLSMYGRTKLAGEQQVQQIGGAYLILRTSWVYSLRRDSFVTKVLQWARSQPGLKLVTDQISGPTWARMLAEVTSQLILLGGNDLIDWFSTHHGLYHLAGSGYCSRMEWGQEVLRLDPHKEEQVIHELLPALTHEFPTPARRPLFSALNCDSFTQAFHLRLPDWKVALKLAMETA